MCSSEEKLIYDTYVEGNLITKDLVQLVKNRSKKLDCEIYRGIFAPNLVLKIGTNINKYYRNKLMSFSKNFNIAKEFTNKSFLDESVINSLKKDGHDVDYAYSPGDYSVFSKVVIRMKNINSLDIYDEYENKLYDREKEVLVATERLYIQSITKEGDTIIADCIM